MTDLVTVFYESELIVRNEADGRVLVGVLVPWDTAVPVDLSGRFQHAAGEAYESFSRGALDKTVSEAKAGIPLYGGAHPANGSKSATKAAGVLLRSQNLPEGHVAEWQLFNNYEGNEAHEMATARIWTGFSGGYLGVRTVEGTLAGRKHFNRQEVKLDHVAFIRNPAYQDAKLLAMRSALEAVDPGAAIRARARMRRLANRLR